MSNSFARMAFLVATLGFGTAAAAPAAPAVPEVKSPEAPPPAASAPVAPVAVAPVSAAPAVPSPAPATDAQRFCQNVAAAAADARFALQTRKLNDLEDGIAQRIAALEAKEAEVKAVLAEHEEAKKRAEASLVAIYGKMRPDAAAQQIAALDDGTAAAVLAALNPRQASTILNEIPAERAVKLVNAIAGLVPGQDKPGQDKKS